MMISTSQEKKKLIEKGVSFLELKYPKLKKNFLNKEIYLIGFGRIVTENTEEIFAKNDFKSNMLSLANYRKSTIDMISILSDISRNLSDDDPETFTRRKNLKQMVKECDDFLCQIHYFINSYK